MPKVSAVIPVYNVEKFIRRCIESIQQQTMNDIELIVVNDCTPDDSMAIVEELAKEDQRIRIFNYDKNRGPMCARETGYMAATGDYITFCDGDDYLPKDALETLYNEAIKTGADIVSGQIVYVSGDGRETIWESSLPYGNDAENVYKALLRHKYIHNLCGKLFKASLLQNFAYKTYEHATNGEDACLFYQVVQYVNKVMHIDNPVYYYVQNIESSTQKRLNENAVRSICISNMITVQTVSNYSELRENLNRGVTNSLCRLYANGYHHDTKLNFLIKAYGLERWTSCYFVIRYLNYVEFAKIIIRRLLQSSSKMFHFPFLKYSRISPCSHY